MKKTGKRIQYAMNFLRRQAEKSIPADLSSTDRVHWGLAVAFAHQLHLANLPPRLLGDPNGASALEAFIVTLGNVRPYWGTKWPPLGAWKRVIDRLGRRYL